MDIIIVLGCSNPNTLKKRLKRAIDYFHSVDISDEISIKPLMIFSGGGKLSGTTEAEIMYKKAIGKYSIDKSRCMFENTSKNTFENIKNCLTLLKEACYFQPTYILPYKFIICTSSFHIKRAYVLGLNILGSYGDIIAIHTNENVSDGETQREMNILNIFLDRIIESQHN